MLLSGAYPEEGRRTTEIEALWWYIVGKPAKGAGVIYGRVKSRAGERN